MRLLSSLIHPFDCESSLKAPTLLQSSSPPQKRFTAVYEVHLSAIKDLHMVSARLQQTCVESGHGLEDDVSGLSRMSPISLYKLPQWHVVVRLLPEQ
jgi:hypothetical protein